jgi:hypothetical protein
VGRACRGTSYGCDRLGAARRPGLRCRVCRAHQGTLHFTDPTGTVHARRSKNCNPKLLHCAKAHVKPGCSAPSYLRRAPLKCDWLPKMPRLAYDRQKVCLMRRRTGRAPASNRRLPPRTVHVASRAFGQRLTQRGRGARPLTCRPPTAAVTASETFDRPVESPQATLSRHSILKSRCHVADIPGRRGMPWSCGAGAVRNYPCVDRRQCLGVTPNRLRIVVQR